MEEKELKSNLPKTDKVAELDVPKPPPAADVDAAFDPVLRNREKEEEEAKRVAEEKAKAEMMAEMKAQILAELASEQEKKVALAAEERKRNAAERAKYVAKMKEAKEPWVDIVGNISDGNGVGIELDWNDAFIDFLRASGINGTDDDEVVQKYITLLLRDMADQMEEEGDTGSEFEG